MKYPTSIINGCVFLATFEHLNKAKKKLEIELIQLHTCLAMFSQSLIWFLFSIYEKGEKGKHYYLLLIPNVIGILTALLNFYFFVDISVKSKSF